MMKISINFKGCKSITDLTCSTQDEEKSFDFWDDIFIAQNKLKHIEESCSLQMQMKGLECQEVYQ